MTKNLIAIDNQKSKVFVNKVKNNQVWSPNKIFLDPFTDYLCKAKLFIFQKSLDYILTSFYESTYRKRKFHYKIGTKVITYPN